MKCMIPEISWHNREPILSIDIQPLENEFYRLATGGSDYHVVIWQGKITENGAITLDVVSNLTRHQRAVNVVRWSPNGQYLASADDDANIIIWNLKTDSIPLLEGETNDKETWVIVKIMRGHKEDIYDLCWSPDGLKILSGSIDNTAIIWDFTKGKSENILTDSKGFVQGVCWDPKGEFIATLSSDRTCRIFEGMGKQVRARISRGILPVPESHPLYKKEVKYFHDDTFKSFFRRLTFTPDGNLIIAPAGCVETEDSKKVLYGTYIFSLDCLTQPVAILPLQKQCSVAIKCCPILYELKPDGPDPVINLPYRMIIAIAAESDLILYDTQQLAPFAHLKKIHYTRLTDLAWSVDGRLLAACSTDGFCTLLTFKPGELGTPYTKEESEMDESFVNVSGCEELEKDVIEAKNKEEKPKKESFLLQWANKIKEDGDKINPNKCMEIDNEESKENKIENKNKTDTFENEVESTIDSEKKLINGIHSECIETIEILDSPKKPKQSEKPIKKVTSRRITPIHLKSPSNQEKKSSTKTKSTPGKRKGKQTESKETIPNSLINFLKVTPDKNKTITGSVNITEESSSARDAWNNEEIKHKTEKMNTEELDDMTEPIPDFKLQLEEGTTQADSIESILIEDSEDEKMTCKEKEINENTTKQNECSSSTYKNLSENVKQSECNEKTQCDEAKSSRDNDNVKKTPRRIQLITLSSPKCKK